MIKTKTIIYIFDQLILHLEDHARNMENFGRMGCVVDRNLKLALAFNDLESTFSAKVARLYIAAARYSIKCNPGHLDDDALQFLHPEQSEIECFRQERLAALREQNLSLLHEDRYHLEQLPARVWLELFCASIEILLELDFSLLQDEAGDFFRVKKNT